MTHAVYVNEYELVDVVVELEGDDVCGEWPPCGGCSSCIILQRDDPAYYVNLNDASGCERCASKLPCVHEDYKKDVDRIVSEGWKV